MPETQSKGYGIGCRVKALRNKPMRASSYLIYVDLPKPAEDVILVHGYTSAYYRASPKVASYIRSLEIRRPPAPLYGSWTSEDHESGPVEQLQLTLSVNLVGGVTLLISASKKKNVSLLELLKSSIRYDYAQNRASCLCRRRIATCDAVTAIRPICGAILCTPRS